MSDPEVRIDRRGAALHVVVPPLGIRRATYGLIWAGVVMAGIFGIVTAARIYGHATGNNRHSIADYACVAVAWTLPVGIVGYAVHRGRLPTTLPVEGDVLSVTVRGLLGARQSSWRRSQLVDVRVGEGDLSVRENRGPWARAAQLQVVPVEGAVRGILTGRSSADLHRIRDEIRAALNF